MKFLTTFVFVNKIKNIYVIDILQILKIYATMIIVIGLYDYSNWVINSALINITLFETWHKIWIEFGIIVTYILIYKTNNYF